jgi:hypothetical protein
MEQQLAAAARERQVAQLVEHHQIDPGELVGQATGSTAEAFALQAVDQVDDPRSCRGQAVEEPAAGVVADTIRSDSYG